MEWAALITWVATAGLGFALLLIWVARGGMTQTAGIRPFLIVSHFLLAATGLAIWIAYLATDNDTLAWIAFVILAVVALLGWTMFAIWYQRRKSRGAVTEAVDPATPAEQHFPIWVIAVHGLLAVTTVLLVLLTALEVGS
jgi:hypothetical protein